MQKKGASHAEALLPPGCATSGGHDQGEAVLNSPQLVHNELVWLPNPFSQKSMVIPFAVKEEGEETHNPHIPVLGEIISRILNSDSDDHDATVVLVMRIHQVNHWWLLSPPVIE